MASSSNCNPLTVDVNYSGVFRGNPLTYSEGVVKSISHVDFEKMDYNSLVEFVEKQTKTKCKGLYYCVPGKTLNNGLRVIRCDLDIYIFLDHGLENGKRIGLYVNHGDENFTDFIREDNLTDLIAAVTTPSDVDSESYNPSVGGDETSESTSLDDEVEDDDVSNVNQTISDPFLNQLCYDNVDGYKEEDDVTSVEDWSENDEAEESDGIEKFVEQGVAYPTYDPTINWKLMKPTVGMKFESPAQLKDSMIDYGVSNGYQLKFPVNDYKRLLVRCGEEETDDENDENDEEHEKDVEDENDEDDSMGKKPSNIKRKKKKVRKCPFRLWASRNSGEDSFQIRSLNEKHVCSRKFSLGSLVTYSWIAKRYFKQIIENPDMSVRAMQTDIMRKFKCKVSIGQCSRAKKKALDDYEGGLKEHYSKLSDYTAEILLTNPGSTVKMVVNEDADGDIYFSSYYICFKGVKDGWMNGCRKIIGLDGCFLKTGQLLSAIGRDANNHIFPLAWAVVSVENKENWKWFLDLLKGDIEMGGGIGLTLISDQHKGIVEAVKDVFPYAEHRQCTRHIYANFKKKFRGVQYKNLFWAAANSTTEHQYEEKMNELKAISREAYSHLIERNPMSWSRAFFEVDRACDAFENGMSESFNSCTRVARRKPIITMLEEIRMFVMQRSFVMATKAEKEEHDVCPTFRKKIERIKLEQRHWKVIPSDNIIFEVRNEKDGFVVNVNEQTCSCRSWQLSGIPCVHTVATLAFINKDPDNYVNKWLKRDMFKEAYKYHIKPLKGSSSWPKTNDIKPLPPKERRMPGRPRVKRKREASEKEIKCSKVGFGRKMTCKNCQEKGHNARSCKNEKRDKLPKQVRPKGRPKRKN